MGRVQTKRAWAFASGTRVYLISASSIRPTGRTGPTRTQGNIFADVDTALWYRDSIVTLSIPTTTQEAVTLYLHLSYDDFY